MTTLAAILALAACWLAFKLWRMDRERKTWSNPDSVRVDTITLTLKLNKPVPGSIAKQIALDLSKEIHERGIIVNDPRVSDDEALYADSIQLGMR